MTYHQYQRGDLGHAYISPSKPVIAGSYGSWQLTYRVGKAGIAIGGGIKISTDSDTDWGDPQFSDATATNYMTVSTTTSSSLSLVLEGGYLRRTLKVIVHNTPMKEGDKIIIVYGDTTQGGPGSQAQTFAEKQRYFRVFVDPGESEYFEIPDPPFLQIIGGSVERLSVLAPSTVTIGNTFAMVIRALDRFGNPSPNYSAKLYFQPSDAIDGPSEYVVKPPDKGVCWVEGFSIVEAGVHRLVVKDPERQLTGLSNPILCQAMPNDYNLYWGDLHGQVKDVEKISDYFQFAQDISALDFASHQRNDHEVSNTDWEKTKQTVKKFHDPHKFVVFLGYEWSGEHEVGGHHNIYYLYDDQPLRRSGHEMVDDRSDVDTDLPHIQDVYKELRGDTTLIIPHVGGGPANLAFHDPELEPVIEVHSAHGTFEWFLREALLRGYKLGFIAGSDDYKLRLGGAYPGIADRRFVRGGLTAIYARQLTREGIFNALKARRCYGTTGDRIILNVTADRALIGEEYATTTPPEISVEVIGTNELDKVQLYRGVEKIYEHPLQINVPKPVNRVKITWQGASLQSSYSGVLWKGSLRVEKGRANSPCFMPIDRGDEFYTITEDGFTWQTYTCGDQDGLTCTVVGEDAELVISCVCSPLVSAMVGTSRRICGPLTQFDKATLRVRIKELKSQPVVIDVGPVDRKIIVRQLRPQSERLKEARFTFTDIDFKKGVNPYWVKVTQIDGEMAWSSPIYVKNK